jgi:phage head maturation protease
MKLSEEQQRDLALRLAQGVIDATSCGFEVTRDCQTHWAISHDQKDEIRMSALFLAEMLEGDQS